MTESNSSSLALADPPIIQRIRKLFAEVRERTDMPGKMGWLANAIMDEALDVMVEETNPEDLSSYLLLTSQIMRWCATGDLADVPDEFRERVDELMPSQIKTPLALET